ncbi:unnamed protein product [Spirodela intermedia]|uniref:Protein kinase domain-containing protein n=1 Tax=Spirodela intermedia TaxID=51605 RepID=A0A7I8LDF8_SPIIN|nr:unnamed protein product [Spirodela intermedia]
MAGGQTAFIKHLRPVNLSRTVIPGSQSGVFPSTDAHPLLDHHLHCCPGVASDVATAVSSVVGHTGGFSTMGFPSPHGVWSAATYSCQHLPPIGFGEQTDASSVTSGLVSAHHSPQEKLRSPSSKKVKFLCSFGGKILPRPSDGVLRYVGGHTRIIALHRDASFQEVMLKMTEAFGGPAVIKYQLPDEDLDALVSVSCPEDFENMIEEYDKLVEASAEGSAKLRVFLLSPTELDISGINLASDFDDSGLRYADLVNNGTVREVPGIKRKESSGSLSSTQASDGGPAELSENTNEGTSFSTSFPTMGSPMAYPDTSTSPMFSISPTATVALDVQCGSGIIPQSQSSTWVEQPLPPPDGTNYLPSTFIDPLQGGFNHVELIHDSSQFQYISPQLLGAAGNLVSPPRYPYLPVMHITAAMPVAPVGRGNPVMTGVETYSDNVWGGGATHISGNPAYVPIQAQSQLPPFPSSLLHQVPQPRILPGQTLGFEDSSLGLRALPHAHSDIMMYQHESNPERGEPFQSLHPEYMASSHVPVRVGAGAVPDNATMHQQGAFRYSQAVESLQDNEVGPREAVSLEKNKVRRPLLFSIASAVPASYGEYLNNRTQAWNEDLLQLQQPPTAQPQYPLKEHPVSINSDANNITSKKNGVTQDSEPPVRVPGVEFSYDDDKPLKGIKGACDFSQPEAPEPNNLRISGFDSQVDNFFPIDGTIQGLCMRRCERSGVIEPWISVDDTYPTADSEIKADNLSTVIKPQDNISPRIREADAFLGKAVVSPQMASETYSFKLVDLDTCLNYPRTEDPNKVCPVLGKLESQNRNPELCTEPPVPREPFHQGSSIIVVSDWSDEASPLYNGVAVGNAVAPSTETETFSLCRDNHDGDVQEPDPSESLFNSIEPWKIMDRSPLLPGRDIIAPSDSFIEKDPENSGESSTGAGSEEESYHHDIDSLSKSACKNVIHHVEDTPEEFIKQELLVLAEGVASSVLQQSIPQHEPLGYENASFYESNNDGTIQGTHLDSQTSSCLGYYKEEDIGMSHKSSLDFPVLEDIGRLQTIRNSDLEELQELGSGTFGTVYHGKWRGSDVAIKRINDRCFSGKQSEQERLRADFWNEACKLADLHHPNVVAFYGVVLDGPGGSVATITEFMVNGSLRQALQRSHKTLDRRKRLLIAMDVAFGMEYLHGKNIVHFDLKSDNLLVNLRDPKRPICKVGDLGLSKVKRRTLISGGVRGTLPWMAPELLNGSSSLVSEKVDVFSFAIVMWELLTGEEPYADMHYGAIIGGIVSNTLRPKIPESCDPEWKSLMERCWSPEPSERPGFAEISKQLRAMAAAIPPKGQLQA